MEGPGVRVALRKNKTYTNSCEGETTMPETITEPMVQQYQNNMIVLCQQKESRLEGTTIPPIAMQGEYLYWERIGATEAVDMVTRHSDTPNIEVDHSRRRSTSAPKVWATLLDTFDMARMLVDPRNYYNQIASMAFKRAKDRLIIAALGGTSYAGKAGTVSVVLPAAQKIAAGTGLTLAKLLTAKEMLDEAEVDEEAPRFIVVASAQITDLLNTTEVKSADYNTVRALMEGKVDTFLGFKFIRTQLLTIAGGVRYCYAYAMGAVGMGRINDIQARIDQRIDKNMAWQPYVQMDMGAARIEEERVVELACTET
jgi:hypothetical protein